MSMRSLALMLGILGLATTAEARSVPLERAAEAGVGVTVTSPSGGYSRVTIVLRNQSQQPVTIAALPGTILDNRADAEQDLTFGGPVSLSVGPGQTVSREMASFCLNQERHSPSPGAQFDVAPNPDPGLAAYIGSRHPDQGGVWEYLRDRGRPAAPPPQPTEMTCVGALGRFQVCVNAQANQVQAGAHAIAPVEPQVTPIPIVQMPEPVVVPPPRAPVVRRHRPRVRPHTPPAAIDEPSPINPGVTIVQD